GNIGTASLNILVINTSVTNAPTVAITSPTSQQVISAPMNIVGTASDANLVSYTITATPVGGGLSHTEATGTTSVTNGVLGTFDPTILADGAYVLTLSAINTGGHGASTTVEVNVKGKLKLGNFKLSFTDLTIPVTGIPITITRSYDTLNAGVKGDFGYGWSL